MINQNQKKWSWSAVFNKKTFFFLAYGALLGISIPHMSFFFASFSDGSDFEWGVAIGAAIVVESSIYISTYAVYKKLEEKLTWGSSFKIFLLVVWNLVCSGLSWLSNVVHAVHFANPAMLSGTDIIPFHQYFPEIAGAWPILGIIFAVVSKTVVEPAKQPDVIAPDTRTPDQIKADTDREIERIRQETRLNKARAAAAGASAGTQLRSRIGGIFGGVVQGLQQGFNNKNQQGEVFEEDNDDFFEDEDLSRSQQPSNRPGLKLVPGQRPSEPITFPPTGDRDLSRGNVALNPSVRQEPRVRPIQRPPVSEIDLDKQTGVPLPVANVKPVTIPKPVEPVGIREVAAKDVGYSFGKPKFVFEGKPYATLGIAFKGGDEVVNKDALNKLWQMSRLPPKVCLIVVVGNNVSRVRAIVDHPTVQAKVAEIIDDLGKKGIFVNQ